jgi:hypothetical protein
VRAWLLALATGTAVAFGGDSNAQQQGENLSPSPATQSAQAISPTATSTAVPTELLVRLEEAPSHTRWYRDWVIVAAIVGWLSSLGQLLWNLKVQREEKTREFLLDSLKWFQGTTQPRSIGIAIVEASWEHHAFMRPFWSSVLATQAIHLLARSKEDDSRVEEANLDRIMRLLVKGKESIDADHKDRLVQVLKDRSNGLLPSGGISLAGFRSQPATWIAELT